SFAVEGLADRNKAAIRLHSSGCGRTVTREISEARNSETVLGVMLGVGTGAVRQFYRFTVIFMNRLKLCRNVSNSNRAVGIKRTLHLEGAQHHWFVRIDAQRLFVIVIFNAADNRFS